MSLRRVHVASQIIVYILLKRAVPFKHGFILFLNKLGDEVFPQEQVKKPGRIVTFQIF